MEMTDEIPYCDTFIGESIVKANPITGMWNLCWDEFIIMK
jgi:hypothetical protein